MGFRFAILERVKLIRQNSLRSTNQVYNFEAVPNSGAASTFYRGNDMADERSNGGKSNANAIQGGKKTPATASNAVVLNNETQTVVVENSNSALDSIKRTLMTTLARVVMIPEIIKTNGLSSRKAAKLFDELEKQHPDIWKEACAAAGIEISGDPASEANAGAIFAGNILKWFMNTDNAQKIADFKKHVSPFIDILLPVFGG